jgi:PKD repeat protein
VRSTDVDGAILSYTFDFGDGTQQVTQSAPTADHAYTRAGTYTVTLTVADDLGAEASATRPITGGMDLSEPADVSQTPTFSQAPSIAIDPAGTISVVWEEAGNDIMFARSTDGGVTFAPPVYVLDPSGPLGSADFFSSGQMLVLAPGSTIHVAWTIFDTLLGGAEIQSSRSTDGGATFSPPLLVSPNDGVNSYGPALAADAGGRVAVVWSDNDLNTGATAIRYAGSEDDGVSFGTPLTVSSSGNCAAVAMDGLFRYVAWTNGPFGHEQILLARSTDGGVTFGTPVVVDHVDAKSWCPHVAVDALGGIIVAWEEGAAFTDRKVMLSRSADQGYTFTEPLVLSDPTTDCACTALTSNGAGGLAVAWTSFASSAIGESWLVTSTDGGGTFSERLRIPQPSAGVGCYAIAARGGKVFDLAWTNAPTAGGGAEILHRAVTVSP